MDNEKKTYGLARLGTTELSMYGSPEAVLMEQLEYDSVADKCTALLTKNCLDNAASLVSYATHLSSVAPEGKPIYEGLVKGYAMSALQRITKGGKQNE